MTVAETTGGTPALALPGPGEAARWGLAFLVIAAAHAGALLFLYSHRAPEPAPPAALEKAMEIELAPLEISVAQAVQSESIAPTAEPRTVEPVAETEIAERTEPQAAEVIEPETSTPVDPQTVTTTEPETARPLEPETAEPSATGEVAEAQQSQDLAEPVPAEEELPEEVAPAVPIEDAEAVLPLPAKPETKPVPRPAPKSATQKPRPRNSARPERTDRAEALRKPAPAPAEASSGVERTAKAREISPLVWQNQVQARVARSVRALSRRQFRGRVAIRFTVAASGAITGVSVARSSGDGSIDRAATEAVQRASPVPPPPPGVGRTLTLPVVFN